MNIFNIITTLINIAISIISFIFSKPTVNQQIKTTIILSTSNQSPKTPEPIHIQNNLFIKRLFFYSTIIISLITFIISCTYNFNTLSLDNIESFFIPACINVSSFLLCIKITLLILLIYKTIKLVTLPFRYLNLFYYGVILISYTLVLIFIYMFNMTEIFSKISFINFTLWENLLYRSPTYSILCLTIFLFFSLDKLLTYLFFPTFFNPLYEVKCRYYLNKFIVFFGSILYTAYWAYILIKWFCSKEILRLLSHKKSLFRFPDKVL